MRGKSFVCAANHTKNSARYKRIYTQGINKCAFNGHAEMILIDKLKHHFNCNDVLHVIRFTKKGTVTMAKPCKYCRAYLARKGVKTVMFTNWNGEWEKMKIDTLN